MNYVLTIELNLELLSTYPCVSNVSEAEGFSTYWSSEDTALYRNSSATLWETNHIFFLLILESEGA